MFMQATSAERKQEAVKPYSRSESIEGTYSLWLAVDSRDQRAPARRVARGACASDL